MAKTLAGGDPEIRKQAPRNVMKVRGGFDGMNWLVESNEKMLVKQEKRGVKRQC